MVAIVLERRGTDGFPRALQFLGFCHRFLHVLHGVQLLGLGDQFQLAGGIGQQRLALELAQVGQHGIEALLQLLDAGLLDRSIELPVLQRLRLDLVQIGDVQILGCQRGQQLFQLRADLVAFVQIALQFGLALLEVFLARLEGLVGKLVELCPQHIVLH